ncbi:MAG: winged helix-turn-helix transcriptional regulator [Flavobacteriaceae bacterium]|nr:winged helix-turn-helix transcriptional regulator [Flavobacteriaceae bacterium]
MSKFKLDELDHQILEALIENARTPFTDIAKNLLVSAGTIHVRVKKMEDEGVIKGSTLSVDYNKMGYTFIAYVGLFVENSSTTQNVIEAVRKIPEVTVAHLTTGKFSIFCKIRAQNTMHAKNIIFSLDRIDGIKRTETSISLEEVINDKKRLMHKIFKEISF